MKHFPTALQEITDRSFDGKWANLSRASGVDASVISRFAADKIAPSLEVLEQLANAMHRHDRRQLLLSAARDRVPTSFQEDIFGDEDPASMLIRSKLSPDLAMIIRYLESNAMADQETAAYLRRLGSWIFREDKPILKVAEESEYKTRGNGTE